MKNKIYIDCQFFQTPAWDRGMGKYTISLLKHCADKFPAGNLVLIFNDNLPKDESMLREVDHTLTSAKIVYLNLATTEKRDYNQAAKINKSTLERFISDDGEPGGIFLIPCLFQEPTVSVYPSGCRRLMIYYDAIPFLYYKKYKSAINYMNYLQRHKTLLESDVIMTISETVKDDLAIYYGIEDTRRRIISIDGAAVEDSQEFKKPAHRIPADYILLTTSDDIRKNNINAVKALSQLNKISGKRLKMVITSHFRKDHQRELERLSKDLIFTGNVSASELNWLYKNARVVLTTSEYEGLGLPILEAARFDKPIACSNIAVFREISSDAFYYFDPLDIEEITLMIQEAIEGEGWHDKRKHYRAINQKYTWERSAMLLMDEIASDYHQPIASEAKPKLAVLCPTPSGYSAVGRVVQEMHDALAAYFEIDYFFEDRKKSPISARPNYLDYVTDTYHVLQFNAAVYARYDTVIYHIGNSEYHFDTIRNALYLPGIAIIHDTKLNECFGEMVRQGYLPIQRFEAETRLNDLAVSDRSAFLASILNNQVGVVVNSDYAKKAADEINLTDVLIKRSFLAMPAPHQVARQADRRAIHVGLGGVLSGKRKGVDLIKNLAEDKNIAEGTIFHIFGFNFMESEDEDDLRRYKNIVVNTDLSDLAYQTQLANLDIMVNYRSEYKGESSSSVLEAMRYECTVIVNGQEGWFAELPDDAVVKVSDSEKLEAALRDLIRSPGKRDKIGRTARKHVIDQHSPTIFAKELRDFYDNVASATNLNARRSGIIKQTRNLDQVLSQLRGAHE